MANGRLDDAIAKYQQLVALNPSLADAWYNLAYLHRCKRHFPDAISAYRMALSCGIDRPEEVHLNLAVILSEHLNQVDQATAELEEALRLNPNFVPALLNLGNLQEDLGQPDQARLSYQNALANDPENGRAIGRIAMIDIFQGKARDSIPVLQSALNGGSAEADDRAEIGFALGHALDALGDYDEAFNAIVAANSAMYQAKPPAFRYDPESHKRLIDDLIRAFPHPHDWRRGLVRRCANIHLRDVSFGLDPCGSDSRLA
jgi:tetratricopeptide (TPR) repeat protein